ncbi:hypothetical protein Tco_0661666, partial [Tanacetum coccineum]
AKIRMFKERTTTLRAPTTFISTRPKALIASTSTRSRDPTASTSTLKASTNSELPLLPLPMHKLLPLQL